VLNLVPLPALWRTNPTELVRQWAICRRRAPRCAWRLSFPCRASVWYLTELCHLRTRRGI